jgi:hypothetical protein
LTDEARAGPKTQSLIEILDTIVALLRRHGEKRWASWLESDRDHIRAGEFRGIRHFLSAFGGMGSVNDLVLHPANGHVPSIEDAARVNADLLGLLSRAYDLATDISREMVFER